MTIPGMHSMPVAQTAHRNYHPLRTTLHGGEHGDTRIRGKDAHCMSRREGSWSLPAALALLAILFAIQVRQTAPPTPIAVDAEPGVFSAGRALDELQNLLGDETPHPVGSAANRAVKERLMARLTELGLRPEEQRTVGCAAESATCAQVENVLAAIPGETADTIVLMAHYDSVPNAPGAGTMALPLRHCSRWRES
jgi:hypothetical protein